MSAEMTAAIAADRAAYPTQKPLYGLSAAITADRNYTPPSAAASSAGAVVGAGKYEFNLSGVPDGATCQVWYKSLGHSSFMAMTAAKYEDAVTDDTNPAPVIEFTENARFYFKLSGVGASTSLTPTLNRLRS